MFPKAVCLLWKNWKKVIGQALNGHFCQFSAWLLFDKQWNKGFPYYKIINEQIQWKTKCNSLNVKNRKEKSGDKED